MRPDPRDALPAASPVRLDKWLWAARFYKTRSLAADAVDGGKVQVNGDRAKPSKTVRRGDEVAGYLWFQPKGAPPLSGAAGEAFALIDQLIKCSDKAKQTAKLLRSA